MKHRLTILVAAVVYLGIFNTPHVYGETNIAVINVAKVFEKYDMTHDLETMFETKRQAAAQEAETRRSSIDQMRRALTAFDPDSEDYARREQDLIRAEVEFQVWSTQTENRMKSDHKKWLLKIYDNVQLAIKELAEKKNIDLVLTYDELTEDAPDSITLRQQILLQKVIFHDERIDITADILKNLNQKYKDDGGIKGQKLSTTSK